MRQLHKEEKRARIYFIRHAESNNNVILDQKNINYEESRVSDPGLSEKGKIQALLCSKYLRERGIHPQIIYSSCFVRALETAKIIQDEFKCEGKLFRELHEIGGLNHKGLGLQGHGRNYFEEAYPSFQLDQSITKEGWFFHAKKETIDQGIERMKRVVEVISNIAEELHKNNSNKDSKIPEIIFISHGNFLDQIVGHLLFRQPNMTTYIAHENTGITAFDVTVTGKFLIKYLNDSCHLDKLNISLHKENSDHQKEDSCAHLTENQQK